MLRDAALIPLSRQHQHALALCVMIQRALAEGQEPTAGGVHHWESQAARLFADEVTYHFAAEEAVLFPAAEQHDSLRALIAELRSEHVTLRAAVKAAGEHRLGAEGLLSLANTLSNHVRKEERQLFEDMQRLIPAAELARLGAALDAFFRDSGMPPESCGLPFSKG